jgi:hypothetical protein
VISFWVDEAHDFGIRQYLEGRGKAISQHFTVRCYDRLSRTVELLGGPQIFAGLDQLTAAGRSLVGELYAQLARSQPDSCLLNDPRRCLLRPALLAALADKGINRFRAYDAAAAEPVKQFPVFVRLAHEHGGRLTRLLESPAALRHALRSLSIRGHRLTDLLIVEYCDTADREGIFRKYAAFKIGNAITPVHMVAGRSWDVKSQSSERTLAFVQEDLQYIEQNPHRDWLQRVFDLAGIDYGRIDYGVSSEGPQAWEVNLNPTIGRGSSQARRRMTSEVADIFDRARGFAHSQLRKAFLALDRQGVSAPIRLTLEPELLARMARESARARRRSTTFAILHRLYGSPAGSPLRFLLARFFPLA